MSISIGDLTARQSIVAMKAAATRHRVAKWRRRHPTGAIILDSDDVPGRPGTPEPVIPSLWCLFTSYSLERTPYTPKSRFYYSSRLAKSDESAVFERAAPSARRLQLVSGRIISAKSGWKSFQLQLGLKFYNIRFILRISFFHPWGWKLQVENHCSPKTLKSSSDWTMRFTMQSIKTCSCLIVHSTTQPTQRLNDKPALHSSRHLSVSVVLLVRASDSITFLINSAASEDAEIGGATGNTTWDESVRLVKISMVLQPLNHVQCFHPQKIIFPWSSHVL